MAISKRGRIDIEVGMKGMAGVDKMSSGVGKLSLGITGLGKSMTGAILKSGLMLGAIKKLSGGIGGAIDTALTWNDWVADGAKELEGMTKATAGIIKPLDLMKTRQQLLGAEIKATEGQMQALAKAAILNARINKSDLGPGLERMTKAVLTGSDTAFRKLGIDAEFLGTKSSKTAQALAALEEHFGSTKIVAENVNEEIGQMSSAMQFATGELGNAILTSKAFRIAFDGIKSTVESISKTLGIFADDTKKISIAQADFAIETVTNILLMNDALSVGGVGPLSDIAKGAQEMLPALIQARKELKAIRREHKEILSIGPQQQFIEKKGPRAAAKAEAARKAAARKAAAIRARRRAKEDREIDRLVSPGKALVSREEASGILADLDRENIARREQVSIYADAAGAIHEMTKGYRELRQVESSAAFQTGETKRIVKETGSEIGDFAKGGLSNFVGGLWGAADAALTAGASFGDAMAQMLKATLLSIGQQATIKALFYTAEGIAAAFTPGMQGAAAGYFTSAAMMGGVAIMAGGAGLAMSAAGVGATPSAAAGAGSTASTPMAGGSSGSNSREPEDINIAVHVGNLTDPSAIYHARQQLEADLQRAGA